MCKAPDVIYRALDSPALATDKPLEVTHHPVHLANHAGYAVRGNRSEFCEWGVVCFEAVEDKSCKVFARRRGADAEERRQLFKTVLERELGGTGQHMVLFKEGSVERDREVLACVETTLDDSVGQTEVGLTFTAAGEVPRMDLFGKLTVVRIGEDDDGLDQPVQDVHLSLCQREHCKRLSDHAGNDFHIDILACIDCDGFLVVVVSEKRLCQRDEALEVERFVDKTRLFKTVADALCHPLALQRRLFGNFVLSGDSLFQVKTRRPARTHCIVGKTALNGNGISWRLRETVARRATRRGAGNNLPVSCRSSTSVSMSPRHFSNCAMKNDCAFSEISNPRRFFCS